MEKFWLDEQRMLLIHSAVMGSLRTELVASLGIERARGFLMRFGYNSGMKDAELAHKVRPEITKIRSVPCRPSASWYKRYGTRRTCRTRI